MNLPDFSPPLRLKAERGWWFLVVVFAVLYGPLLLGWCPAGGDLVNSYLPYQQLVRTAVRAGDAPFYNAMTFCGRPLMADIQTGVLYPPNWLHWILPLPLSFALVVALHGAWMLWGCWRLGRALDFTPAAINLASVLYAASPFFLLKNSTGVVLFLYAGAWWPWLAWGFFRRRFLLLPWIFALSLLAGAPQITYYGWVAVFLLAMLWPAASLREQIRNFTLLCLTMVAGLGLSAIQVIQTSYMVGHSFERGGGGAGWEYITDGSLAPRLLWLLINPGLLGDFAHQDELYWGKPPDFAEGCYYLPFWALTLLIPLALALMPSRTRVDLSVRQRRALIFLALSAIIISPLFAMGEFSPLFKFAYEYVPGFNRFRVPARLMSLEICGVALLAGMGIDSLRRNALNQRGRAICAFGFGLLLSMALLVGTHLGRNSLWRFLNNPFLQPNPQIVHFAQMTVARANVTLLLVLSGVVLAALCLSLFIWKRQPGWLSCLSPIALTELVLLGWHFQMLTPHAKFNSTYYPRTELVQLLQKENHGGRILWLDDLIDWHVDQNQPEIFPNRLIMHSLPEARGYDPINARWFGEWMNLLAGTSPETNPRGFMFVPQIARPAWLTLMGVELVLCYKDLSAVPGLHLVASLTFPEGLLKLYHNERYRGFTFAAPMPHIARDDNTARLASARLAENPAADPLSTIVTTPEIINEVLSATALVDGRFQVDPLQRGNHVFAYQVKFPSAALLCFTQSAWPGWSVSIDGELSLLSPLSGTFIAVNVPAGLHNIRFDFQPEGYALGKMISLLTVAVLLYLSLRRHVIRHKQSTQSKTQMILPI